MKYILIFTNSKRFLRRIPLTFWDSDKLTIKLSTLDLTTFSLEVLYTQMTFYFVRNLSKLKEGIGEKLGAVANSMGTAVLCFCVALPLGWELALACATVMPFSIAAAVALSNVTMDK